MKAAPLHGFGPLITLPGVEGGYSITTLANGTVLIAGGCDGAISADHPASTKALIFDPATGSISATGNMKIGRCGHTATLLNDGHVFIQGGTGTPRDNTEIYDPIKGVFTATGPMDAGKAATRLRDGRVFIAGTKNGVEIYDPATGVFTEAGGTDPATLPPNYLTTATLLNDGHVLVTGSSQVWLYEPEKDAFRNLTRSLPDRPAEHDWNAAVGLRDGRVLLLMLNGTLFDPKTESFAVLSHRPADMSMSAALRDDGNVIVQIDTGAIVKFEPAVGYFVSLDAKPAIDSTAKIVNLPGGYLLFAGWTTTDVVRGEIQLYHL